MYEGFGECSDSSLPEGTCIYNILYNLIKIYVLYIY